MSDVDTTRLVYFEMGPHDMNAHEESGIAMELLVRPKWREVHRHSPIGQQKEWTKANE